MCPSRAIRYIILYISCYGLALHILFLTYTGFLCCYSVKVKVFNNKSYCLVSIPMLSFLANMDNSENQLGNVHCPRVQLSGVLSS